jgi:hypothetical protein
MECLKEMCGKVEHIKFLQDSVDFWKSLALHYSGVAQLAEQCLDKAQAEGPNPSVATII